MNDPPLVRMAVDLPTYRQYLVIDRDGVPSPYKLDPWQQRDFEATDAGWLRAVGRQATGGYGRAWLSRCRGASKTTDIAASCCHALAFAPRKVVGVCAAADQDQARLLVAAIEKLIALNPTWLGVLQADRWKITNVKTGSELTALSADAQSSYGLLVDFAVCDEVAAWDGERGEALWISLLSAVAKRKHAFMAAITNACRIGTWPHQVCERVEVDPAWYVHHLRELPSWIDRERVEEQRRLLPALAFARLWDNLPVAASAEAISQEDLDAAITVAGPMTGDEDGWRFASGLDVGLVRDFSSLVTVARHRTGRVRLADVRTWTPAGGGGRVSLDAVRTAVIDVSRRFRGAPVAYDPWNCGLLAETCRLEGCRMHEMPFTTTTTMAMASTMIEHFQSRTLDMWAHAGLLSALRRLQVTPTSRGWKLTAPRSEAGHSDAAFALGLALYLSTTDVTEGALFSTDDIQRALTDEVMPMEFSW